MKLWSFGKKESKPIVDSNNNNVHEQNLRHELLSLIESKKNENNTQGTKQRRIDEITAELKEIEIIKEKEARIRANHPNLFQSKGGYKKSKKRKSKRKSKSYKKRLTHS